MSDNRKYIESLVDKLLSQYRDTEKLPEAFRQDLISAIETKKLIPYDASFLDGTLKKWWKWSRVYIPYMIKTRRTWEGMDQNEETLMRLQAQAGIERAEPTPTSTKEKATQYGATYAQDRTNEMMALRYFDCYIVHVDENGDLRALLEEDDPIIERALSRLKGSI